MMFGEDLALDLIKDKLPGASDKFLKIAYILLLKELQKRGIKIKKTALED